MSPQHGMVPRNRVVALTRRVRIEQAIAMGFSRAHILAREHVQGWELDAVWIDMNNAVEPYERESDWTDYDL